MTNLTADTARTYAMGADDVYTEIAVAATTDLFEGMALGDSSGLAAVADGTLTFIGFAIKRADNNPSVTGRRAHIIQRGRIKLILGETITADSLNATVYAHDSNDFDISSTGGVAIGKIESVADAATDTAWVYFEALGVRSV